MYESSHVNILIIKNNYSFVEDFREEDVASISINNYKAKITTRTYETIEKEGPQCSVTVKVKMLYILIDQLDSKRLLYKDGLGGSAAFDGGDPWPPSTFVFTSTCRKSIIGV